MPASVFDCNLETVSVENGQPWGEVGEGVENSDTETIVMVGEGVENSDTETIVMGIVER